MGRLFTVNGELRVQCGRCVDRGVVEWWLVEEWLPEGWLAALGRPLVG